MDDISELLAELRGASTTEREARLTSLPAELSRLLRLLLDAGDLTTPPSAASTPRLGEMFGGTYRLLELLGQGATSTVYLARDTLLDRDVALKIYKPGLIKIWRNVLDEARRTAKAKSQRVITIMNASERGLYLELEYLPGATSICGCPAKGQASVDLRRRPKSVTEALEWTRQAAEGVADALTQGVYHRDIKPANLLWTSRGIIVTDFGAGAMGAQGTPAVAGTPGYMDPLLASACLKGEQVDHATLASADVYSLGATLYELVSGRTPDDGFRGLEDEELLKAISRSRPRPLNISGDRFQVPARVQRFIEISMSADLSERAKISSAREFQAELNRYLNNEKMLFERGAILGVSLWLKKNPTYLAWISSGLATIASLLVLTGIFIGGIVLGREFVAVVNSRIAAAEAELTKVKEEKIRSETALRAEQDAESIAKKSASESEAKLAEKNADLDRASSELSQRLNELTLARGKLANLLTSGTRQQQALLAAESTVSAYERKLREEQDKQTDYARTNAELAAKRKDLEERLSLRDRQYRDSERRVSGLTLELQRATEALEAAKHSLGTDAVDAGGLRDEPKDAGGQ